MEHMISIFHGVTEMLKGIVDELKSLKEMSACISFDPL